MSTTDRTPGARSVSVVIPCFNVEACVGDAIESCLSQTLSPAEIICVDDGSEDGTRSVLESFARTPGSRVVLVQGEHRGAGVARNVGLNRVREALVQFLDADDVLSGDKLERQVAALPRDAEVLVAAPYARASGTAKSMRIDVRTDDPWIALMEARLGTTSSNLWPASAVRDAGGWSETLRSSQEYELMFRMLARGTGVVFDDVVRTEVRTRPGASITETNLAANCERWIDLRLQIHEHLAKARLLSPSREAAWEQAVFGMIRSLYRHDPESALVRHAELPRMFRPHATAVNSRLYVHAYRWLGFRGAEALRWVTAAASGRLR